MYFQPSIANTTNIDTLLVATEQEDKMIAPAENVQDKIAFIFNNLSQVNLQTKVKKLFFFQTIYRLNRLLYLNVFTVFLLYSVMKLEKLSPMNVYHGYHNI